LLLLIYFNLELGRGDMVLRRVSNPPNPWLSDQHEWLDDIEPPKASLEIFEDDSRSILSRNDSPDLPFRWSINPYRGCQHSCGYCYARPSHEYLGFGAGTDFDFKIIMKPRAGQLLKEAFHKKSWRGELIHFSGITDCYQPIEAVYKLTRACLELCRDYCNPVSIITKGALIERDMDLLIELNKAASCDVCLSIPFLDNDTARKIEPGAPTPSRRLKTLRILSAAGIPTGVFVAPLIPGLNDREIPALLKAIKEAGALWVDSALLRLPGSVQAVFEQRLLAAFPNRAKKVMRLLAECRGGDISGRAAGHRMTGQGPRYEAIRQLFHVTARRLDFGTAPGVQEGSFRRPGQGRQLRLFE
jgi:DNA repair photolyase